jgi:hypothetical protein
MKMEQTQCSETSAIKHHTQGNTQKIIRNIQNTAKAWNQELLIHFTYGFLFTYSQFILRIPSPYLTNLHTFFHSVSCPNLLIAGWKLFHGGFLPLCESKNIRTHCQKCRVFMTCKRMGHSASESQFREARRRCLKPINPGWMRPINTALKTFILVQTKCPPFPFKETYGTLLQVTKSHAKRYRDEHSLLPIYYPPTQLFSPSRYPSFRLFQLKQCTHLSHFPFTALPSFIWSH